MNTEKNFVTFLKESYILIAILLGLIVVEYFFVNFLISKVIPNFYEGTAFAVYISFESKIFTNSFIEIIIYSLAIFIYDSWKEEKKILKIVKEKIYLFFMTIPLTLIFLNEKETKFYLIMVFLISIIILLNSIILDQVKKILAKGNNFLFCGKKRKSHKLGDFFLTQKNIIFNLF